MNHHDNAKFLFTLGTEWLREGGSALQSYKVCSHAVDETFDDPAFA